MSILFSKKAAITAIALFWGLAVESLPAYHPDDSIKAVMLYRKAIESARKGDPGEALGYFNESLLYRRKVFGEKHYRLGSTYLGMGIQYKNLYQLENAFKYYKLAEEMFLFNAPPNDSRLGDIYSNLGNYYHLKGNFTESVKYQERAVEIYEDATDEIPPGNYLSAVYNLGYAYFHANREEEALSLVKKYCSKGDLSQQIKFRNLLASIFTAMNNYKEADSVYSSTVKIATLEYGENNHILAEQYTYYAQFLNRISRPDSALHFLAKTASIYSSHPTNASVLADLYSFMADAFVKKSIRTSFLQGFQSEKIQNLSVAILNYEKSLKMFNDNWNGHLTESDLFRESNFPLPTLRILRDLGNACLQTAYLTASEPGYLKVNMLKKALEYFTSGTDLANHLRTGFVSEESKILFTELQHTIFNLAVESAYELFQQTHEKAWAEIAFENAERNKAVSIFDHITEHKTREFTLIPDSLTGMEYSFNSSLAFYREKLYNEQQKSEPDSSKISNYRTQIFAVEKKINELRETLEREYSEYYDLKYKQESLKFRDLQRKIKRNEVLISYSVNSPGTNINGELYIFSITKNDFRFIRKKFTAQEMNDIQTLCSLLSDRNFLNSGKNEFQLYCKSAYRLYSLLIMPVRDLIPGKRITLIPDGILCYLPFDALLTRETGGTAIRYHELPYFILDHTINYSYSAELFKLNQKKSFFGKNKAVAFAPDYPGLIVSEGDSVYLPVLTGIHDEVEYLSNKINTESFQGIKATEKAFREIIPDFKILHLAMHALINDSLPLYSKLAFYPGHPDSLHNDGWVNTSDIYNFRLKARMTVLSSCNSGHGILRKGEGLMSLARGFYYAGCPSVVMTLWEVEDRSGSDIMKEFYRNLKFGKPIDGALRNSKLHHLKNADPLTAHPHFWLGYITTGNPDPLFHGREFFFTAALFAAIILIMIDLLKSRKGKQ